MEVRKTSRVFAMLGASLLLCVSGGAKADVIPLPPPGYMTVSAASAFAEIFLEVTDAQNPLGLAPGLYNDIGIGFTIDGGAGGSSAFVLYKGAGTVRTDAPTSEKPFGPDEILYVGNGDFIRAIFSNNAADPNNPTNTVGRLGVVGVVDQITTRTGPGGFAVGSQSYKLGPNDGRSGPQVTFILFDAAVQDMALNTSSFIFPAPFEDKSFGGMLFTDWKLGGEENPLKLEFFGDWTADAETGMLPGDIRYKSVSPTAGGGPELPIRDTDGTLLFDPINGTYYDVNGSFGNLAFVGDPADNETRFWTMIGNPDAFFNVSESFTLGGDFAEAFTVAFDPDGPGPLDPYDVTFYAAGPSEVGIAMEGQLIRNDDDPGTQNSGLMPVDHPYGDYHISAKFNFGGVITGAYDSDPWTFSFQQEPIGIVTNTQISGYLIPEPATMATLVMGVSLVVGRIRRRRRA